jgi:hypothetical protein
MIDGPRGGALTHSLSNIEKLNRLNSSFFENAFTFSVISAKVRNYDKIAVQSYLVDYDFSL